MYSFRVYITLVFFNIYVLDLELSLACTTFSLMINQSNFIFLFDILSELLVDFSTLTTYIFLIFREVVVCLTKTIGFRLDNKILF